MHARFPAGDAAWRERITRLILDTDVAIKRLWKNFPQLPDPEVGLPYTGPLDPRSFMLFGQPRSGSVSAATGGTGGTPIGTGSFVGTTGGCPNSIVVEIAGVTPDDCVNCDVLNGSFTIPRLIDPVLCHYYYALPANACGFSAIYASYLGGRWSVGVLFGFFDQIAEWSVEGVPATGQHTLSLQAGALPQCNWPGTITVTAI